MVLAQFAYMTCVAIGAGVITALLTVLIWGSLKKVSWPPNALKVFFLVVWAYGFIVYDIGMSHGNKWFFLVNAPICIIDAFKIFLFDNDISHIEEELKKDWFYSLNFALVHFLAAIVSTLFIVKVFGYSLKKKVRLWRISRCDSKTIDETFLFWGFNEQSKRLIEDIEKHFLSKRNSEGQAKECRIILVRSDNGGDEIPADRSKLYRILDFISIPTSEFEQIQILPIEVVSTYRNLTNVKVGRKTVDIFEEELRLKTLGRVLKNRTKEKIHVFFLSDDEKENIHNASVMANDKTLRNFVEGEKNRKVVIYCHARYNSVHRVIEEQHLKDNCKIKVIDSSHINVEMLKLDSNLLPVNYVDVEGDATVSSHFRALVIGFSEVGQDSVKFLYEFGSFVRHGSTSNKVWRSDFRVDVIDRKMAALAGPFIANAPSVDISMSFMEGFNPHADSHIVLHDMDCESVQFYKCFEKWIKTLNYIVIATGDDELNMTLGVRLFKMAIRYRVNLDKFCILVRAHEDRDEHFQNIAYHYNRLWAAHRETTEKDFIHQNQVKREDKVEFPIHIFGLDSKTYTYANIVEDCLESNAREYHKRYTLTTKPHCDSPEKEWDNELKDIMHLEKENESYSPTYGGVMKLRRSRLQDFANSQHETTKQILVDKSLIKTGKEGFSFHHLTRKDKQSSYIWPEGVQKDMAIHRILIVLAQTEHLRWQSSHEINGYVYHKKKDETKFTHNNLKKWDNLNTETRSYDCNIVDCTLGIKPI